MTIVKSTSPKAGEARVAKPKLKLIDIEVGDSVHMREAQGEIAFDCRGASVSAKRGSENGRSPRGETEVDFAFLERVGATAASAK